MKMNSYKYIGVLTVFLLLMLQNMMAQTPDFTKMTHAQQVEYIKQQKQQAEVLKQKLIKQFNTPPQGTEKKKTGSVFVTFKRTILHSYNETKTSSDGAVNTQSGNSKVNINVNVSTEKVVVSDNGNSFSVTAYGDQHPESVPLQGSGVITDEEEGQTELSNSKGQGSISLDMANSQVSFDYNKDSKKGAVNITGAYSIPTGVASIHYISNTSTGGDISASYMQGLKMIGLTYGQVGVYNYEVMEEAFKHMTPAMIQQSNEGREMSGNGGQCVINVTKKGYKITYTNTATLSKVDDGWTGTNTYTITNQVHMSIGEKPSVLDAILEPDDMQAYNKFMPEGKKVDGSTTKGNTLGFHVRIIDKSDPTKDVSYEHPFTVTYSLVDVSSYPGICMNYPVKDDADTKPDLKWDDQMNAMAHLGSKNETTAISKKKEGVSFPAFITSYDYAAYGVLKAHVVLNNDNDLEIEAHFPDRPGETFIRIPKDDNGNKIADEWEVQMGIFDKNYDATRDEDDQMSQMRTGDGLTMFEEYRGFKAKRNIILQGSKEIEKVGHVRTDPSHKDIFVYDPDDIIKMYYEAYNPANMCIHYITKEEMNFTGKPLATDNRWINFNYVSEYAYARQYVICARQTAMPDNDPDALGATINSYSLAGLPVESWNRKEIWMRPVFRDEELEVSPDRALVTVQHLIDIKIIKLEDKDRVIKNMLVSTVIHEMGHYMGILHHHFPEHRKPVNEKYNVTVEEDDDKMCGVVSCPMRYGTYTEYMTTASWLTLYTSYCRKSMTGFRVTCVEGDAFSINALRLFLVSEVHCDFTPEIITGDDCWGQIDVKTDPQ